MAVLRILLGIAYPALIYLAVSVAQPRTVAAVALLLIAARLAFTSPGKLVGYVRALGLPMLAVALILAAAAVWNSPMSLLLTPALVSFTLFAVFTRSLATGQPMAEKFARLQIDDPTDAEIRYCRRVTIVWCAFLLANGTYSSGSSSPRSSPTGIGVSDATSAPRPIRSFAACFRRAPGEPRRHPQCGRRSRGERPREDTDAPDDAHPAPVTGGPGPTGRRELPGAGLVRSR